MSTRIERPYDVFVSYSEPDESWVLSELCPRLEDAALRIIHRGDFSPGTPMVDELDRAIKECPWTLLVVTPSYLGDTWAHYEEVLASSEVLRTGEWRVIPVLIKGPCDLPGRFVTWFALTSRRTIAASGGGWSPGSVVKGTLRPPDRSGSGTQSGS